MLLSKNSCIVLLKALITLFETFVNLMERGDNNEA